MTDQQIHELESLLPEADISCLPQHLNDAIRLWWHGRDYIPAWLGGGMYYPPMASEVAQDIIDRLHASEERKRIAEERRRIYRELHPIATIAAEIAPHVVLPHSVR